MCRLALDGLKPNTTYHGHLQSVVAAAWRGVTKDTREGLRTYQRSNDYKIVKRNYDAQNERDVDLRL